MKQLLLSTLFLFTLKAVSLGQSAVLTGKVIVKNVHSLTDATILVEDHEKGTVSDNSGSFLMTKLPNGKLKISYLSYQTKLIDTVLSAGKTTKILINLEEGFVQGTEVVILEDRLKGQAKTLNQKKLIISNQQELAFNIYNSEEHIVLEFKRIVSLSTIETERCKLTTTALSGFPNALFIAMSDDRTFHYYDQKDVLEGNPADK